jgi:hypothetical protein
VIAQLALGTLIVIVNAIMQAEMFSRFGRRLEQSMLFLRRYFHRFANTAAIVLCALFVMFVHTVQVWVWAVTFHLTGALNGFEPSLYFSLVSFTTVGYGDITLGPEWRLLSGIAAANGLLSFGWSTAYMVELVRRTA